jgi:hypothetical protein
MVKPVLVGNGSIRRPREIDTWRHSVTAPDGDGQSMAKLTDIIRKFTPLFALRGYRSLRGRWDRNDLLINRDAEPSPLVTDVFATIREIPGYCTYDDSVAFTIILGVQAAMGLTGDVLEIGSYHGRSAVVLAGLLRENERFMAIDSFDMEGGDDYPDKPTPERLRSNLKKSLPTFDLERLDIVVGDSTMIDLPAARRFRFIHIDGGHSYDVVKADLGLASSHLLQGGVIALDDYHHARWPEVTRAADDFRAKRPDWTTVADVSRYGDSGRKLYFSLNG